MNAQDIIRAHERNWRAVWEELKDELPDGCFAGVDVDHNSQQVIAAIRKLRAQIPTFAGDASRGGDVGETDP